jgi:L-asparaginase II
VGEAPARGREGKPGVLSAPLVRVIRSGIVESVHLGSVAVADAEGNVVASAGDPSTVAFARSSMKPLQTAVSLSLAGDGIPTQEVAVMCASHNGEEVHVRTVGSLLGRAGLGFDALRTPASLPLDQDSARAVREPRPEFHNCSGKHAGMLVASSRRELELSSYPDPGHPFQQEVLEAVVRASGQAPASVGVDGCGVPVHALRLDSMATLYARLAVPERLGDLEPYARGAVAAMGAHPYLVGGRGRVCTGLMEVAPGVVVKVGAEGLICAALLDRGLGVAVKIGDGSARAADPALIRALAILDVLDASTLERVGPFARPAVLGGGRPVGELVAGFDLSR